MGYCLSEITMQLEQFYDRYEFTPRIRTQIFTILLLSLIPITVIDTFERYHDNRLLLRWQQEVGYASKSLNYKRQMENFSHGTNKIILSYI